MSVRNQQQQWLHVFPNPKASIRLLCFPHGGGNALSLYAPWAEKCADYEIVSVLLPGRGTKLFDDSKEWSVHGVAAAVARAVTTDIQGAVKPLAVFGHSCGAAYAYETTVLLAQCGLPPFLCVVSALDAPVSPHVVRSASQLDTMSFLEEYSDVIHLPVELLQALSPEHNGGHAHGPAVDPSLAVRVVGAIRGDFEAAFRYRLTAPLGRQTLLAIIGGACDTSTTPAGLSAWALSGTICVEAAAPLLLPRSGHHYLNEDSLFDSLTKVVAAALASAPLALTVAGSEPFCPFPKVPPVRISIPTTIAAMYLTAIQAVSRHYNAEHSFSAVIDFPVVETPQTDGLVSFRCRTVSYLQFHRTVCTITAFLAARLHHLVPAVSASAAVPSPHDVCDPADFVGVCVGLYLASSAERVAAMTAVISTGLPYLALELAYPASLLERIASVSSPALILTTSDVLHQLPKSMQQVAYLIDDCCSNCGDGAASFSPQHYPWGVDPSSFALSSLPSVIRTATPASPYALLFSGGTTGIPKAITLHHASVVTSFMHRVEHFPYLNAALNPSFTTSIPPSRIATNVFFVWEALRPILVGATTLVIPDTVIYDVSVLPAILSLSVPFQVNQSGAQHPCEEILLTPSLFGALCDFMQKNTSARPALCRVWLCGEVVPQSLVSAAKVVMPTTELCNLYSISECHDVSIEVITHAVETPSTQSAVSSAIADCPDVFTIGPASCGFAMDGVSIAIVALQPHDIPLNLPLHCSFEYGASSTAFLPQILPVGVVGEVLVGGPAVGPGYVSADHLNLCRFPTLPHHECGLPSRWYRTGDLGRLDASGSLQICGRCDSMVKIRGYSVELNSVESCILTHVAGVVCLVLESQSASGDTISDKSIVAVLTVPSHIPLRARDGSSILYDFCDDQGRDFLRHLRDAVQEELPFYCVPSVWVPVRAIPAHSASAKADRSLCRKLAIQWIESSPPSKPSLPLSGSSFRVGPVDSLCRTVADIIAALTGSVLSTRDYEVPLFALGVHSLLLAALVSRLHDSMKTSSIPSRSLTVATLLEHHTVRAIAEYLAGSACLPRDELGSSAAQSPAPPPPLSDDPPVLVGVSCRLPNADHVAAFWQALISSECCLSKSPITPAKPLPDGCRYVPTTGSLCSEAYTSFDTGHFGISLREAALMDPQHRLAIELAEEALSDAGFSGDSFDLSISAKTAVFGSSFLSTHALEELVPRGLAGWRGLDPVAAHMYEVSVEKDYLPLRLSWLFNMQGPSMSVQTSCSSGLVAVDAACAALSRGSDAALVVSSSLTLPAGGGYITTDDSVLSSSGYVNTFDENCDGTILTDGGVALLFLRKSMAQALGCTAYATVRASAVNNDGRCVEKASFFAPSVTGQANVIREAWQMALREESLPPNCSLCIECHGTGTKVGDGVELAALVKGIRSASKAVASTDIPLLISSVKPNFGHSNIASGAVGFLRGALSCLLGTVPPHLGIRTRPTSVFDFKANGVEVSSALRSIHNPLLGVSSFGVGGTNSHVVLCQSTTSRVPCSSTLPFAFFVVGAMSIDALQQDLRVIGDYLSHFHDNHDPTGAVPLNCAYCTLAAATRVEGIPLLVAIGAAVSCSRLSVAVRTGSCRDINTFVLTTVIVPSHLSLPSAALVFHQLSTALDSGTDGDIFTQKVTSVDPQVQTCIRGVIPSALKANLTALPSLRLLKPENLVAFLFPGMDKSSEMERCAFSMTPRARELLSLHMLDCSRALKYFLGQLGALVESIRSLAGIALFTGTFSDDALVDRITRYIEQSVLGNVTSADFNVTCDVLTRTLELFVVQAPIVIASVTLAAVLKEGGVAPDVALGHSLGQFSAFAACSLLTLEFSLVLLLARCLSIASTLDPAATFGMRVFRASATTMETVLASHNASQVYICCLNASDATVVTGHSDALEQFASDPSLASTASAYIPHSAPLHTPLLTAATAAFTAFFKKLDVVTMPLTAKFIESTFGQVYDRGCTVFNGALCEIIASQLVKPVNWTVAMKRLLGDCSILGSSPVLVEVGPHCTLSKLASLHCRNEKVDRLVCMSSLTTASTLFATVAALSGNVLNSLRQLSCLSPSEYRSIRCAGVPPRALHRQVVRISDSTDSPNADLSVVGQSSMWSDAEDQTPIMHYPTAVEVIPAYPFPEPRVFLSSVVFLSIDDAPSAMVEAFRSIFCGVGERSVTFTSHQLTSSCSDSLLGHTKNCKCPLGSYLAQASTVIVAFPHNSIDSTSSDCTLLLLAIVQHFALLKSCGQGRDLVVLARGATAHLVDIRGEQACPVSASTIPVVLSSGYEVSGLLHSASVIDVPVPTRRMSGVTIARAVCNIISSFHSPKHIFTPVSTGVERSIVQGIFALSGSDALGTRYHSVALVPFVPQASPLSAPSLSPTPSKNTRLVLVIIGGNGRVGILLRKFLHQHFSSGSADPHEPAVVREFREAISFCWGLGASIRDMDIVISTRQQGSSPSVSHEPKRGIIEHIVYGVDVAQEVTVDALLDFASSKGTVVGVLNLATVAVAKPLLSAAAEDFRSELPPKVHGMRVLTRSAVKVFQSKQRLPITVFFSSSSAIFGGHGLALYGAANAMADSRGACCNGSDVQSTAVSVAWDDWSDLESDNPYGSQQPQLYHVLSNKPPSLDRSTACCALLKALVAGIHAPTGSFRWYAVLCRGVSSRAPPAATFIQSAPFQPCVLSPPTSPVVRNTSIPLDSSGTMPAFDAAIIRSAPPPVMRDIIKAFATTLHRASDSLSSTSDFFINGGDSLSASALLPLLNGALRRHGLPGLVSVQQFLGCRTPDEVLQAAQAEQQAAAEM